MWTTKKGDLLALRLYPGDDFFKGLENACRQNHIKTGIIICAIGQIKNFKLGFFREKGDYCPDEFEVPHELLGLSGNIILQDNIYKFHIHAIVGDNNKHVFGGHLLQATCEITNEIFILETGLELKREREDETGLEGLFPTN